QIPQGLPANGRITVQEPLDGLIGPRFGIHARSAHAIDAVSLQASWLFGEHLAQHLKNEFGVTWSSLLSPHCPTRVRFHERPAVARNPRPDRLAKYSLEPRPNQHAPDADWVKQPGFCCAP